MRQSGLSQSLLVPSALPVNSLPLPFLCDEGLEFLV